LNTTGGGTLVPGRLGGALTLGPGDRPQSVAAGAALQPQAVTVTAWVRADGAPGFARYLVAKGGDLDCSKASYALYTGHAGAPGLRFYVDAGGTLAFSPSGGTALWDGAWHMVAGTYDGAAVRLYVDGREAGAGTPATGAIDYALAFSPLNIGGFSGAASCRGLETRFFGATDEVRIYDRALPASEIARLAGV
jgi:beta-galactosidase